jgi:ABC-type polar amino acid transport system ATPase subunit
MKKAGPANGSRAAAAGVGSSSSATAATSSNSGGQQQHAGWRRAALRAAAMGPCHGAAIICEQTTGSLLPYNAGES